MATVLHSAYVWTSLILVLAVLGAVLASRSEVRGKFLPAVLAAAAVLAPAEQARLHTTVSLQKHVVFGAWFAAIAAGYAMARLSRVDPGRGWAAVMALPIAASTLFGSLGQAAALYKVWPNAAAWSASSGRRSTLIRATTWPRTTTSRLTTCAPKFPGSAGPARTTSATRGQLLERLLRGRDQRHYFSLVILDFGDTAATDTQITADMSQAGGYYVLARAGRFTIWAHAAGGPASWGESWPSLSLPAEQRPDMYLPQPPDARRNTSTSASSAAGCSRGCSSRPAGSFTATSTWPSAPGWSPRSCGCC